MEFQGKSFFDGESSALTAEGRQVMDIFCDVVAPYTEHIRQVNVLGHTSQGTPDRPNRPRTDRMLSAMRAAEVTIYIQEKGIVSPEKLVSIAYGQFRPVADVGTREGRAQNRRVELLILDEGTEEKSLEQYFEDYINGNADKLTAAGFGQADTDIEETAPGSENIASVQGAAGAEADAEAGGTADTGDAAGAAEAGDAAEPAGADAAPPQGGNVPQE